MKSFTAIAFAVASAAFAAAQNPVIYNSTTGIFTCPASNPNGAYCASGSLQSPIIIRCKNGIGQPGNCDDNLSGTPPFGIYYAPCWETSDTSGDAACSKNCIVYGASGTFSIDGCVPLSTSSSSSSTSATSTSSTSTPSLTPSSTSSSVSASTTSSSSIVSSASSASGTAASSSSSTTAIINSITTLGTTVYKTSYTTTYCPSSTLSSVIIHPSSSASVKQLSSTSVAPASSAASPSLILATGTGSGSEPSSNSTSATGGGSPGSSATATPVGPTSSSIPIVTTGAAVANAGSVLAALGLFIAYFL